MSKKLLKESTIRRFGGLAGIKPISTSHFLSEMGDITYARDDEEDEFAMDEPVADELEVEDEIEDEIEDEVESEISGDAEGLVMSLLGKVKEWASEQNIEIELDGDGAEDMDMDMGGLEGDVAIDDMELAGDLDADLDVDAVEFEEEEETLEEMINSILSEEEEEELEEDANPFAKKEVKSESRRRTSKRRAPANEARRRTKQTKRAKSRGVKVQVLSDNKVIQEVTKRVKNRLARIAKAQKRRS